MQKPVEWSHEKNEWLKTHRGICFCFEDIASAIDSDKLLATEDNPSSRYPHQRMYTVLMGGYVYLVPFVEDDTKIFLKTVIPSRKATKKFYKQTS